jgi:hypothetical protein
VLHVNRILIATALVLLLSAAAVKGVDGEVGMGMAPNFINMTLDMGEKRSTNLIIYNPYEVGYYAFIKVECKSCDRNISFLGHTVVEIHEDVSQYMDILELNVFLKNNTSLQEGRNVFPMMKAPAWYTEHLKLNFLGGLPLTIKMPLLGSKGVNGVIMATSEGLGTNLSIGIIWQLTMRGIPFEFLALLVMAMLLAATLVARFLFLRRNR